MGLYTIWRKIRIYIHLFLNDGGEDTAGCLPNIYFSASRFPSLPCVTPSSAGESWLVMASWGTLSSLALGWDARPSMWPAIWKLETDYLLYPHSTDMGGICGIAVAILGLLWELGHQRRLRHWNVRDAALMFCVVPLAPDSNDPVGHSVSNQEGPSWRTEAGTETEKEGIKEPEWTYLFLCLQVSVL